VHVIQFGGSSVYPSVYPSLEYVIYIVFFNNYGYIRERIAVRSVGPTGTYILLKWVIFFPYSIWTFLMYMYIQDYLWDILLKGVMYKRCKNKYKYNN
jgi:hypothetical protein